MTPRFSPIRRLAWIERELGDAARLLDAMVPDLIDLRRHGEAAGVRIMLLSAVAAAALAPLGVDRGLLARFVDAMHPDADVADAEELTGEIVAQVLLISAQVEGEG